MLAGWVSAGIAAASFFHVTERRVVVAVGAEDVALAFDAGSEIEQLEVVQWALQLLVQFDISVLWQ